jgi:hypothetical protein
MSEIPDARKYRSRKRNKKPVVRQDDSALMQRFDDSLIARINKARTYAQWVDVIERVVNAQSNNNLREQVGALFAEMSPSVIGLRILGARNREDWSVVADEVIAAHKKSELAEKDRKTFFSTCPYKAVKARVRLTLYTSAVIKLQGKMIPPPVQPARPTTPIARGYCRGFAALASLNL